MPAKNKVFGLGLSKTGTSSLAAALRMLGYKTVHNPADDESLQALLYGQVRCAATEVNDAVCDILFVRHFQELDMEFERSQFILTVRNQRHWLTSCRHHWAARYAKLHDLANEDLVDFNVYGSTRFRKRMFNAIYQAHCRQVELYFQDRPNDLLVMDICAGDGWEKLCPFLRRGVPDIPFPHVRPRPWCRNSRDGLNGFIGRQLDLFDNPVPDPVCFPPDSLETSCEWVPRHAVLGQHPPTEVFWSPP